MYFFNTYIIYIITPNDILIYWKYYARKLHTNSRQTTLSVPYMIKPFSTLIIYILPFFYAPIYDPTIYIHIHYTTYRLSSLQQFTAQWKGYHKCGMLKIEKLMVTNRRAFTLRRITAELYIRDQRGR